MTAERLDSIEHEKTERYALISVSDKSGVADIARVLDKLGYRIISTGGTAKTLTEAGLSVIPIQDITGNPESFDGRMKTISFEAESGILFDRKNSSHVQQARELGIKSIDIVICNLYPFEQTVANPQVTLEQAVESIDVGGPTMVRSAAKNFKNVLVVVDPEDYAQVAKALLTGAVDVEMRRALAARAFDHSSFYDAQIAQFLRTEDYPKEIAIPGRRTLRLRQGENPHQEDAWLYLEPNTNSPLKSLEHHGGREVSLTNLADMAAGIESVRMFDEPAAAIIKHNSASGVAVDFILSSPAEALKMALESDYTSAFGSTIVLNRPIDIEVARVFAEIKADYGVQIDIAAAPGIDPEALAFIRSVRKTTGVYTFGDIPAKRSNPRQLKFVDGGFLTQKWDDDHERSFPNWKVAGKHAPTEKQLEQMKVAWKFISRIRSNTVIVVDRDKPMTRGIGSGQPSRIGSAKIAVEQAGKHAVGAILASDALIPFEDVAELAAKSRVGAIVQTGGAIRDEKILQICDQAGIPVVFTGERRFYH